MSQQTTQMILANRFANPGKFEKDFLAYLEKTGCTVDINKNIAWGVIADMRVVQGLENINFFDGTFNAAVTNMENSYQMPKDEHKLIYGIRVYEGTFLETDITTTTWSPGFALAETMNSNFSLLNNGNQEITQIFGTEFLPSVTDYMQGFVFLQQPFIWQGQTNIKLNLAFKNAPATVNQSVLVELHYIGLTA